jgi:glyoxylase-like metal-dependent hydrolase (beta-lactamase superfamily II)
LHLHWFLDVTVSALEGGHLTLPERLFVTDADPEKRATVPSLCFLIEHPSRDGKTTKMVFDLGLKRDLTKYPPAQQAHIKNRQPTILEPDCAGSLRAGGLDPAKDIDLVMLSHVHWDHEGTPDDFPNSQFVVGSGTIHLLSHGAPPHYPREIFNPDLLPKERTRELPPTSVDSDTAAASQTEHQWKPFAGFPHTVDFFGDGSVYVVDSPGHLFGHVNLLARLGPDRWVYLGGDCCHDPRILTGERDIALYDDGHGGMRSVHVDTELARHTLCMITPLLKKPCVAIQGDNGQPADIEVVVAHDGGWRERNPDKFFPGKI